MIKKYLGIVGFLLAFFGIMISVFYKYSYKMNLDPLAEISFLVWITTWTISSEINKKNPKKWWTYTVSALSLVAIIIIVFYLN